MKQQENLTPVPDEAIIRQHADMVYRLAYAQTRSKSDADDIFQEVFLRYIQRKPDFVSEEHCKAWFLRVTVNCAKKHWESWWFRHTAPLEESIPFQDPITTALPLPAGSMAGYTSRLPPVSAHHVMHRSSSASAFFM